MWSGVRRPEGKAQERGGLMLASSDNNAVQIAAINSWLRYL